MFGAHCSLVHKMMVFLVMIILVCYKGLTFVTCLITGPENEGVSRNNFNAIESYPNLNKVDQFSTIGSSIILGLNVPTSHIMEMGCRQCLPFSLTTLRIKHCQHPIAVMRLVDTFGLHEQ